MGSVCTICSRIWFSQNLRPLKPKHRDLLMTITNITDPSLAKSWYTCYTALYSGKIPAMSTYNGFTFLTVPEDFPKLDPVSERSISPRLPFMKINRLRRYIDQPRIFGQDIYVPVSVNNMVTSLPRDIADDFSIYVHINKQLIHKSSYVGGLINKGDIKKWLKYLVKKDLFKKEKITINPQFLSNYDDDDFVNEAALRETYQYMHINPQHVDATAADKILNDGISLSLEVLLRENFVPNVIEDTNIDESLIAMQQTSLGTNNDTLTSSEIIIS